MCVPRNPRTSHVTLHGLAIECHQSLDDLHHFALHHSGTVQVIGYLCAWPTVTFTTRARPQEYQLTRTSVKHAFVQRNPGIGHVRESKVRYTVRESYQTSGTFGGKVWLRNPRYQTQDTYTSVLALALEAEFQIENIPACLPA